MLPDKRLIRFGAWAFAQGGHLPTGNLSYSLSQRGLGVLVFLPKHMAGRSSHIGGLAKSGQICPEVCGLALAKRHGDSELLQILLERFSSQRDIS